MGPITEISAGSLTNQKHGELGVKHYPNMPRTREDRSSLIDDHAGKSKLWPQLTYSPGEGRANAEPLPVDQRRQRLTIAPTGGAAKRACDIIIAGTTLLLMAPTMIIISLLIYFTMGGPVFFVQQRVGFDRRMFGCLKFRTMVVDANERLAAYLESNPEAAVAWRETQKLKNDPRVTWLGHVLRKTSLDELPQLFNVLRGEMSCIGPRPVLLDELKRYGDHGDEYARAKPGLTGMWQVNGRSKTSYTHRVNCDRYYVRRWSLMLDMRILFRTIPAVLKFNETA
jgi:exopolysaccharide production protein ExoY